MNEISGKLQNGGRFVSPAIAAIAGALLGSLVTAWGPSKADFLTVREHVEFQQHLADKFVMQEKEMSDLKIALHDIADSIEKLKIQIDTRFNSVEFKQQHK